MFPYGHPSKHESGNPLLSITVYVYLTGDQILLSAAPSCLYGPMNEW